MRILTSTGFIEAFRCARGTEVRERECPYTQFYGTLDQSSEIQPKELFDQYKDQPDYQPQMLLNK